MSTRTKSRNFPAPEHNHAACLAGAHARAFAALEARGLRMTPIREKVFAEIAASHAAIGAYEVLDRLAAKGTRLAPISVYRALDVLVEAGVVHKLESQNAFFACHSPDEHSGPLARGAQLFLTCDTCGTVAEVAARPTEEAILAAAIAHRFTITRSVIEVRGTCAHCVTTRR
ncbi:MAG TPA: Fur family transcriptional regulator [Hyphomicrobiaceae bacterium]|nr:Fur family transcriptional regulator [Hyphomicrobiaceae bacterium]